MIQAIRRVIQFSRVLIPAIALSAVAANAQFYKLHNADIALGGTGQFTRTLTSNGTTATGTNQQFTTDSAGFIASLREHPVAWAGIELNYSYTRYSDIFDYHVPATTATQTTRVSSAAHEATAAYMFHPHFFHLQPFFNVGGGAIDFDPRDHGNYQWRGAGLVETGFDIPTGKHFGFRVQGRSLYYRAPNFGTSVTSTRSWVVTTEPSLSAYLRF